MWEETEQSGKALCEMNELFKGSITDLSTWKTEQGT